MPTRPHPGAHGGKPIGAFRTSGALSSGRPQAVVLSFCFPALFQTGGFAKEGLPRVLGHSIGAAHAVSVPSLTVLGPVQRPRRRRQVSTQNDRQKTSPGSADAQKEIIKYSETMINTEDEGSSLWLLTYLHPFYDHQQPEVKTQCYYRGMRRRKAGT